MSFSIDINKIPDLMSKAKKRRDDILLDKSFINFHLTTVEGLFKEYQKIVEDKKEVSMFMFAEMILSYIIVSELHEKLIIKVSSNGDNKNNIGNKS